MFKKSLIACAVLVVGLTGCAQDINSTDQAKTVVSADQLAGQTFFITSIDGKELNKNLKADMMFKNDHQISGRGFCNLYSGTYEVNFRGLVEAKTMATRRMCDEEKMNADMKLHQILGSQMTFEKTASGYNIVSENGSLSLMPVEIVDTKK